MARTLTLHGLSSFSVLLMAITLDVPSVASLGRTAIDPEEHIYAVWAVVKGFVVGVGVDAAEAAAAAAEAAEKRTAVSYHRVCTVRMRTEVAPERFGEAVPFLDHGTLAAALAGAGRDPARRMHSSQDRDCWAQGYFWVEVEEILTWAARGRPLNTSSRTLLWPNSGRETGPGLIFLAVRRARCTSCRRGTLRIAWK
jgi:hypothetical protein